jgi:hypothetical protein
MGYSLLSDINGNSISTKDMKLTPSAEKQLEVKNNKIMEKSKQVERIATKIEESLQLWETIGGSAKDKHETEIKQFPKMYDPTDDSISIPLFTNGKKIVVEIKSV